MKVAIYGTGSVALRLYQELSAKYGQDYIVFFIDSMVKKHEFCNKPVYSLQDLKEKDVNLYQYYLGSISSQKSMKEELLKIGVLEENICKDFDYSEDNFESTIKKVEKLLIYPEPKKGKKDELEETLEQYLGDKRNEISIDYVLKENCLDYDLILVWNKEHLQDKEIFLSKKRFCIDDMFYPTIAGRLLTRLSYLLSGEKKIEEYQTISKKVLKKLKEKNARAAYIFASGPLLEEGIRIYKKKQEQQVIRIVCNAFIKAGAEIMKIIQPQIYMLLDILFLDVVYKGIMDQIADYVKNNDCYLVVPDFWIPALQCRYDLDTKIMGVKIGASHITFLEEEHMAVYNKAANVITTFGIPIASVLAPKVYLAGCDGFRNNAEKMNGWQYSKLACTNIADLPTEDTWDYEEKHYTYFKDILSYGEKKGIYYETITKSYIPCLKERYKGS